MTQVFSDKPEGAKGSCSYGRGWDNIDEIAIVALPENSGQPSSLERAMEAIDALDISIGETHPDETNCWLKSIDYEILDKNTVKLSLHFAQFIYGPPKRFQNNAVEVGASLIQLESDIDCDDVKLEWPAYTYPDKSDDWGTDAGKVKEKRPILYNKQIPLPTWKKDKIEEASPEAKAIAYVGTVNGDEWRGFAIHTWLCTSIIGRSNDGGTTWEVAYNFQYNPKTWQVVAYYIRSDGKAVPATEQVEGQTIKHIDAYQEQLFGAGGLELS